MKTAISIPDRVFHEAEKAAKRLKLSRSQLYRQALELFLSSGTENALQESYDAAFSEAQSQGERAFRRRATRKTLLAVEWKE